MKFRCKYEYAKPYGSPKHVWTVIGRDGAMHLHITDLGKEYGERHGERYSAGLETHYRQPPSYMNNDAPSQDTCWLLGQPCWHDGTSLYAQEHLLPLWLAYRDDHERMFEILQREYENQFGRAKTETEEAA